MIKRKLLFAEILIIFVLAVLFAVCAVYFRFGSNLSTVLTDENLKESGYVGVLTLLLLGIPSFFVWLCIVLCSGLSVMLATLGGIVLYATLKDKRTILYVMLCIWSAFSVLFILIFLILIILLGSLFADIGGIKIAALIFLISSATVLLTTASILAIINAVKADKQDKHALAYK